MRTEAQFEEHLKIKRHGDQLRLSRETYRTHLICPDCYMPAGRCVHLKELKDEANNNPKGR